MPLYVALLGYLVAALSAVSVLPQLLRLLRTRSTVGLSLPTAVLATVTMWAWCCYTVRVRDIPALVSSVIPLLVWSSITTFTTLALPSLRKAQIAMALLGLLALPLHPALSAPIAVCGSLVWIVPQGIHALRSSRLHAVSQAAYTLVLVENVLWIAYGVLVGHLAYAAAPLVQIPMSIMIVLRSRSATKLADGPTAPDAPLSVVSP